MFGVAVPRGTAAAVALALLLALPGAAVAVFAAYRMPHGKAWNRSERYTVKKGDSLSALSRRFYGTPSRWKMLARFNRTQDIRPGQVLLVPREGLFVYPDWPLYAVLAVALAAVILAAGRGVLPQEGAEKTLVTIAACGTCLSVLAATVLGVALALLAHPWLAAPAGFAGLVCGVTFPGLVFHGAGVSAGRSVAGGMLVLFACGVAAGTFCYFAMFIP